MIRSHKISSVRKTLLLSLAATSLVLFAGVVTTNSIVLAQTRPPLPIPSGTPAALIKRIVVSNKQQPETSIGQATVTRAGSIAPITTDLLLYKGDLIETFADTQVTVLFLDVPVPGRDNEVIIDANARVGISSSDSWWGRAWAKVKDAFTSETRYARLSARGTEYDLTVCSDDPRSVVCKGEGRAILVVLEGTVEVEKGTFKLAGQNASLAPESIRSRVRYPQFLLASFFPESPVQERFKRALDVPTGQITQFDTTYHLHNDCKQPHRIEFRTSDSTDWFRLLGDRIVEIAGGQNLAVARSLVIDATRLTAGKYEAHVYAVCLDCNLEARCPEQQLDYGYGITVTGPPPTPTPIVTPSPTVTPTPTNQRFTVNAREESAVTRGFDQPGPAPTPNILAVLDWTNQVILTTQPSYSTQNLIPHFATTAQRSQNFRDARQRAILANEPGSNKTLGDIYSDWGQGAWAVFAYLKEVSQGQGPSGNSLIDRGEAYRLTGQLDEARKAVPPGAEPKTPRALNLLGNLDFDEARIALDKGDHNRARDYLERARKSYADASQVTTTALPTGATTLQTNLAETHLVAGDLALKEKATQEAKARYAAAMQSLAPVQQPNSIYPFGVTDLGRAYQGLGDVAVLERNPSEARTAYEKAKQQHNQAIAAHQDFAEAYFNLGDLFDDLGEKDKAKANYRLAIRNRPEQPASYYPLALLVQEENPQLAAALASTYLQLEPEVFKQGEKAENAQRIAQGEKVVRPPRVGEQLDTISTNKTVPDILNKTRSEAISAIQNAGFSVGREESQSDPRAVGTVIAQRPVAGTPAAQGSAIEMVVSTGVARTGEPGVVPNVLNMSQTDATKVIENAGLKVGKIKPKESVNQPKGTVIKQSPQADKKAKIGSAVDLEVSAGVEVPDLVRKDFKSARNKIAEKRLAVGNIETRADCKLVDKVIEQNPAPGLMVEPGAAINLLIGSLGDNPVTIPRFTDRNSAQVFINENGLTLRRVTTEETDSFAEGAVLRQSPKAGEQYGRNCPVNVDLTVAIPIVWVDVGNYVGLSIDQARQQLRAIELDAQVSFQETADKPQGTVVAQSPVPPARVRHRTSINLVVAIPPKPQVELVLVPPLCNLTLQAARAALFARGLINTDEDLVDKPPNQQPCGAADAGNVMWQNPPANTKVPKGTRVKLALVGIGEQ